MRVFASLNRKHLKDIFKFYRSLPFLIFDFYLYIYFSKAKNIFV